MPAHILSSTLNPISLSGTEAQATPFDDIDSVVATYEQRVFRFLLVSTRDADAAHSITQDTFLKAWAARASFRNECSVSTWLMRIAVNLLRDHTRTERFRFWKRAAASSVDVADPAIHLTQPGSSPESRLIASEQLTLVWDTVAKLSERQRSIFVLRFVEEMELSDIAHATGLPVPTVKSHLYRALNTVRARHNSAHKESPMKITNPNQHLNHEQICDLLLDNGSQSTADAAQDTNREHLQACLICASELELLRSSVTNFRSASVTIADRAFARRELQPAFSSRAEKHPARTLTPAYFWAATALLFTAALPLGLYHSNLNPFLKHPQPAVVATTAATKTSTLESDEALLEGINQELSASVPSPLQPLASTNGNASAQTTSSQQ